MANRLPTERELDQFIDAALRDEPLLPVPAGLHRKIQDRVVIAAMQERERARFRNSLLSAVGALVVILAGTVAVVSLTHFSILYRHGVSGGRGFVDYYLTLLDVTWSGQIGGYALLLALGLSMGALWMGLILLRIQLRLAPVASRLSGGGPNSPTLRRVP